MEQSSFEFAIEEIKRRLSIVDLIGNFVSLKKAGRNHIGLCPFHDDKNPSLHVNDEKGLYHCFSCGAGGDIFAFSMNYNNIPFKESVESLAKSLNIEIVSNKPTRRSSARVCRSLPRTDTRSS